MIITKPETTEDLYPLFKQILIEKHKRDPKAGWGILTYTGKGFYLKLEGDYEYEYIRKPVGIEHPDEYVLNKFHMYPEYNETVYLDRFIKMSFYKDMKGHVGLWAKKIYQHE